MSGITTATVIAGVGAAASVASAAYSIFATGAKASGASQEAQVSTSESTAMSARSQLLETAGGAAGSPLVPGQVGGKNDTIFGN